MGEVKPFPAPGAGPNVSAPVLLKPDHDLTNFDCNDQPLNEWLRKRALKNQADHASRTFVVCCGAVVIGYYSLSNGSVARDLAIGSVKRNMPDPIPALVLGRLAVDRRWQNQGVGASLLQNALWRMLQISEHSAVRVMLVHAKGEASKQFYRRHGFHASPMQELTLMLPIGELQDVLR